MLTENNCPPPTLFMAKFKEKFVFVAWKQKHIIVQVQRV